MRILNAEVRHDGRLVINKLKIPREHVKYFRQGVIYTGYDLPVIKDVGLLNVGAVGSLITYGWMLNEDVEVNTLDETYVKSMERTHKFFEKTYEMTFDSELIVKKTTDTQSTSDRTALFFSGGLDSTYSLFHNYEKKPRLIMLCGYDAYLSHGDELNVRREWVRTYRAFAKKIGLPINFVYTDTRYVLKDGLIDKNVDRGFKITYWGFLRHGVCLAGLASPISDRFGRLMISANGCVEYDTVRKDNPFSTGVNVTPNIRFSNIDIIYEGAIDRFRKAIEIKPWLESGIVTIKSCPYAVSGFNCNCCEKCLRTMSQLVLAGVDPNTVGLNTDGAWERFVDMCKQGNIKKRRVYIHFMPMKKYILENNPPLPEESRVFFDFLLETDLHEYAQSLPA